MTSPLSRHAQWRLDPGAHTEGRAAVLGRRALRTYCCQATYASFPALAPRPASRHATAESRSYIVAMLQVYTTATTRVTISIVHDSQHVVDTIGPVSIAELKTEKMFNDHGPESISRRKSFVLWRDDSNPEVLVLSMVRRIADGDVTKRCYRLVVRVEEDTDSPEYSPTVAYYDGSTLRPSTETRFAMASKTPIEASQKMKRLAAAAGTPGTGRDVSTRAPSASAAAAAGGRPRGDKQSHQKPRKRRRAAGEEQASLEPQSTQQQARPALPATDTDAAAELVKLLTGQAKITMAGVTQHTTDAEMFTPCTPSAAMLGSLPAVLVVKAESREVAVPRMPSAMRWREQEQQQQQQQQPLHPQPTGDGVAKGQPLHSVSQDASVSSASSHSEATALATLGGWPGCEAPTVHLRTDSDGRVTMGL